MKTQDEFQEKLKKHLRYGRKKLMPQKLAKQMGLNSGIYFGFEKGIVQISVYQLYQFMHLTGKDLEYIVQLFDDSYYPPSMRE